MEMIIIVLVVVVVALIGVNLWFYMRHVNECDALTNACNKQKEKIVELEKRYSDAHSKLMFLDSVHDNYTNTILQLNNRINELVSERNAEDQCKDYSVRLEELKELLSGNVTEIEKKTAELSELNELLVKENDKLREIEKDAEEKCASMKLMESRIVGLREELCGLKETHRKALMVVEGEVAADHSFPTFTFASLTANESRIVGLIKEIIIDYPELSLELGKIVWSKVWMPKIQAIVRRDDFSEVSHHAIYKLTLGDEEGKVCYIGQAVDVKERWYTHIKKMVGAEARGGEKLYNGGWLPNDFTWSVLEWGLSGKSEMDEKERYWIDFFGGVEVGLNSK